MTKESNSTKIFIKLDLTNNSEVLEPKININIYTIQIPDPFKEDSFIFIFDTVKPREQLPFNTPRTTIKQRQKQRRKEKLTRGHNT